MKRWVQGGIALAVTALCFWWTFRNAHWDELWISLQAANHLQLVPYVGLLTVIHVLRILRWGNLLSGQERVSFLPLAQAASIGFMMQIVLPFRLGEFARPILISEVSSIRKSAAMTSVVLERIADGIVVAVLLRGLLFFVPRTSPDVAYLEWAANLVFLVFFGGLVFLLLARWKHEVVNGLVRATLGRISAKVAARAIGVIDGFVGALRQLPDGRNFALFVVFTVGAWGLSGWGVAMLANAFDCSHATAGASCSPLHLTVFQGFVTLAALNIGLMIPAAPGSAGTFQAFTLLGLQLFVTTAVARASGVAFANVLWVAQLGLQIAIGLLFLAASRGSMSRIMSTLGTQQREGGP